MPRVQRTPCRLAELAAALVGSATGAEATAFSVCEFSCSCCRSSTSLAADALCTLLLTDSSACEEFCYKTNGLQALQVGLCSSNSVVVCATIRVVGALLQALLLHTHLTVDAATAKGTPCHSKDAATPQKQLEQLQSPDVQTHGHLDYANAPEAAKPAHQQPAQQQHGQRDLQGCSQPVDWLDGTCSSSSLFSGYPRRPNLVGALDVDLPTAAMKLQAVGAPPIADCSSASDTITTGALDAAMVADSMLSALLVCASSGSNSSSSSACVEARIGALLELQQFMLLLADTQADAPTPHTASACDSEAPAAPHAASHGTVGAGFEQQQGGNSSSTNRRTHPPALLYMGWLQETVALCMRALTHEDATMRRAASQALAAALVLQD